MKKSNFARDLIGIMDDAEQMKMTLSKKSHAASGWCNRNIDYEIQRKMTVKFDFDKKELCLTSIVHYNYTRFEECPVPHTDEGSELYHLTKLMEKADDKTRSMCT